MSEKSFQYGPPSGLVEATSLLSLSPQEQYLYNIHLNNLWGDGKVTNPDGSISTLKQAVVGGPGGYYYNIPTIYQGKELNIRDAMTLAGQLGWSNFPAYTSPEKADERYEQMHKYIESDIEPYMRTRSK